MTTEYLLSTNNFKRPKVVTDSKALCILIVRLILLEPGTRLDMPEAGLGLKSRYSFVSEKDIPSLETELMQQITEYIPEAQGANIQCKFKETSNIMEKNTFSIIIQVDDYIAEYNMDDLDSANIKDSTKIRLSDL